MIVNGADIAEAAKSSKYDGVPYSEMDCQSFVEHVLADCDINHNWLGSNDMWRHMVSDKQTVQECLIKNGGQVPEGYICFTIKHDGKEPSRYTDGVNAAHVGVVLDNNRVRHSTTGGVQYDTITNASRWTHVAKHNDVTYLDDATAETITMGHIYKILQDIKALLEEEGNDSDE